MDDSTLEEKCEDLMNIVVESRKIFGKRCAEYQRKTAVVENQLLNLQINTISNFKSKHKPSSVDATDVCNDTEDVEVFISEIIERQRRIENLRKKLKDTQDIVLQLKQEGTGQILLQPSTAEALLARAKQKQGIQ